MLKPVVVLSLVVSCALAAGTAGHAEAGQPPAGDLPGAAQRYAMLVAEDARPATRAEAEPLLRGLASPSARIVRQAVRALGRLERAEYLPELRRSLADPDPGVRAEAANAIAQIAKGDPDGSLTALRARFEIERDPVAQGALCDAMGRLPFPKHDARFAVEGLLTRAFGGEFSPLAGRLGAVRGLESLVRNARGAPFSPGQDTLRALRTAALGLSRPNGAGDEDRVRRTAILALNNAGAADSIYERLAIDRDPQVRRLAVVAAGGSVTAELRERLVRVGLADQSPVVRYDALRVHGRHLAAEQCQPEVDAVKDGNAHVALLAIDLLATSCPGREDVAGVLAALPAAEGWRHQAHALVALARRAPSTARPLLAAVAAHGVWQARVYAARAAAILEDAEVLLTLSADAQPNVRAAAIDGLKQVKKHDADATYREAFARPDYPVVMAAARALEGTPDPSSATVALLQTLATITRQERDTSRDARLAILDRLAELGGQAHVEALAPYEADADPRIAIRAAEILTVWTGDSREVKTTRVRTLALPPQGEMETLPAGIRVTMASGRSFDLQTCP